MRKITVLPGVDVTVGDPAEVFINIGEYLEAHGFDTTPEDQQLVLQVILNAIEQFPEGVVFGLSLEDDNGEEGSATWDE